MIEGPIVTNLVGEFNWRWETLEGSPLKAEIAPLIQEGLPVQFLAQRPGQAEIAAAYFEQINAAQKQIILASPYISYTPFLRALVQARQRGVKVVLIFPQQTSDMDISQRVFQSQQQLLLEGGVELYANNRRMVHSKVMVVDGRQTIIGSFNLDYRSFKHDLESAVVVEDSAFGNEVINRVFQSYLDISERVTTVPRKWFLLEWLVQPFT